MKSQSEPLQIVVVENHEDTLRYLCLYLKQLGHKPHAARTMQEALELLSTTRCDVLISDIGLPDGDGWQLLEQAALPERVFTIAMTGFGMSSDREKSRQVGYRRHLLKPFDPVALDDILQEAMDGRSSDNGGH